MIQNYPQGYIQPSIPPSSQAPVTNEVKSSPTVPQPPIRKNTSEYDKIMQEYNKLNSQAIGAERRGDVVPKAVYERLSQLKESADNLLRTGRAFYYEKQEVKPEQQYTVNIEGKGYSVAPALQSQFIENKTGYIYEPKALEQGQMILLGKNINGVTVPVSTISQDTSPYRQEVKLNQISGGISNGNFTNSIFGGLPSGSINNFNPNFLASNLGNTQTTPQVPFQKANPSIVSAGIGGEIQPASKIFD